MKTVIIKTGNKGATRWEMIMTNEQGNTYSIYAQYKKDLIEYKKTNNLK
tara:strand:- start:1671 stop:1817 length:147 start_codon:yes stop_codon:yes gene_type:complete